MAALRQLSGLAILAVVRRASRHTLRAVRRRGDVPATAPSLQLIGESELAEREGREPLAGSTSDAGGKVTQVVAAFGTVPIA